MTDDPGSQVRIASTIGPFALVPAWVLGMGLSGGELATYVALRSFADRTGEARPYVRTIAGRAGVSERTAERAIARMRELGLLTTTRRHRDNGEIAGCDYLLHDQDPRRTTAATPPHVATLAAPVSPGTDGAVARGTDAAVARVATPMSEQEHTTEQTTLNRPREQGARTSEPHTARLAASLRSDHPNQNDQRRRGPAVVERQRQADRVAGEAPLVYRVAGDLLDVHGARLVIGPTKLRDLLRPALDNGVEPVTLKRAVAWLLDNGKQLAPWTLQEAVAVVTKPVSQKPDGW